jgi:glycosyltransferase involved in cell wall biosynthesis
MELAPLLLAQGLQKKGQQVSIWTDPGTFLGKKTLEGRFQVQPFHYHGYFSPRGIREIREALVKEKPDLIHLHNTRDLPVVVPALKISGWRGPLLLTKHVASNIVKKDILHRWLYRRLDYLLTCSDFIRKNVLETCPVAADKVETSYVPVDLQRFRFSRQARVKLRRSWGWEKNTIVGMVARVTPGKGHELFLRVAGKLVQKDPRVRFRLTGLHSPGEKWFFLEMLALRKKMGLEKSVILEDRVDDVPGFFSALDLVLHTAPAESFGMAVAEAMACGRPVVVRRGGGVAEILEADEGKARGGLVIDGSDPEVWADRVSGLLRSKALMGKLGRETRKMVARFSLDLWVENHLRWYRKLLGRGTPAL